MEKRDLYRKIGKNIQQERQKQGYTQETFAELMHKSWSYVSKIESGVINISLGKIWDFAHFLNIDVEKLLTTKKR